MLKTTKSGATYMCPITKKTSIKVEGRYGSWGVIDACLIGTELYALLESEQYGDEAALLLVKLPKKNDSYIVEKDSCGNDVNIKYYIRQQMEMAETYDDIVTALLDEDLIDNEDDCDMLTDEEINNYGVTIQ